MGMFDLPANPWQPQTNIATKLRELYVRLGLLGNNRQQDIQNAIQDPAGVAERLAGTVNEYIQDPMSYVGGGIGHIAYHGSPYKFDKFSLDKIGTGEGAQAYGHGLYLAEAPEVAKGYAARVADQKMTVDPTYNIDGKIIKDSELSVMFPNEWNLIQHIASNGHDAAALAQAKHIATQDAALAKLGKPVPDAFIRARQKVADSLERFKNAKIEYKTNAVTPEEQLYKTDIPDEAVARFLDWDKPLSQQAPEVQAALQKSGLLKEDGSLSFMYNETPRAGSDMYERITSPLAKKIRGEDSASEFLRKQGIPGIRYLDGGSRGRTGGELIDVSQKNGQWFSKIRKDGSKISGQIGDVIPQGSMFTTSMPFKTESEARQWAQQQINGGTSNFVAFDPELIRILERNGQPTGNQPWKPGEFNIFKDTTESAPLFRDTTR